MLLPVLVLQCAVNISQLIIFAVSPHLRYLVLRMRLREKGIGATPQYGGTTSRKWPILAREIAIYLATYVDVNNDEKWLKLVRLTWN